MPGKRFPGAKAPHSAPGRRRFAGRSRRMTDRGWQSVLRQPVGRMCGRTDILVSGRQQPCRLCRKHLRPCTLIPAMSWKSICIRELRFCTPPKKGIVQKHIYHSISNLHLTAKTRFRVKPGMTQESQRWRRRKRKRQRNRYQARSAATRGCSRGSAPSMNEGTGYKKRQAPRACLFLYPRGESNAYRRNRNPKFYPLNYRGMPDRDCKYT